MSDHTPGPWYAGETLDIFAECQEDGEDPIASIHERVNHNDCFAPEARANARLIAAAPNLLEAVNDLLACLSARRREQLVHKREEEIVAEAHTVLVEVENDPQDEA